MNFSFSVPVNSILKAWLYAEFLGIFLHWVDSFSSQINPPYTTMEIRLLSASPLNATRSRRDFAKIFDANMPHPKQSTA
jgi:hypothetical protein